MADYEIVGTARAMRGDGAVMEGEGVCVEITTEYSSLAWVDASESFGAPPGVTGFAGFQPQSELVAVTGRIWCGAALWAFIGQEGSAMADERRDVRLDIAAPQDGFTQHWLFPVFRATGNREGRFHEGGNGMRAFQWGRDFVPELS